jgi:hypothetical protein
MQFIHSLASMRWPSSIKNKPINTTTLSMSQRNWTQQRTLLSEAKTDKEKKKRQITDKKRKQQRIPTLEDVKSFNPNQMKLLHQRIIRFARPNLELNFRLHKPKLSGKKIGDLKKEFFLAGVPFPKIPHNKVLKKGKTVRNPTVFVPKGHIHQRKQLERYKLSKDT